MKKFSEYLVGDIKSDSDMKQGAQFLEELAELMLKYRIDHVTMGWKAPSFSQPKLKAVQ